MKTKKKTLLIALLPSKKKTERKFAVKKVLEVRGDEELGDTEPRSRLTPKLNFQAKKCQDLIAWDKEVIHEPIFTCSLSKKDIKAIINQPLEPPYYPLHTQSTERAVKLTTEASSSVFGFEKRHGFILSRMGSRQAISSYRSKKNLVNLF